MKGHFLSLFMGILTLSCASINSTRTIKDVKALEDKFQDHVGFMLYDPFEKKVITAYNSDRYFTPASNTKIFTLYASLNIIPDTIPAFYYLEKNDSLILWGSGDPSLLYNKLPQHDGIEFLKSIDKKLYFSNANFKEEHFGPGWAWDDYEYSFSVERSGLTLYGNRLTISKKTKGPFLSINQPYFKPYFSLGDSVSTSSIISRDWAKNDFSYFPNVLSDTFEEDIPFTTDPKLLANLLSDTLSREVKLLHQPIDERALAYGGIVADSAYKAMMQESDNFVSEQLLLVCSGVINKNLNTASIIEYVTKNHLEGMPDKPVWIDGSGLSRYNLFTPRSIVWLWDQLRLQVPQDRLFSLLAAGGESGTLKDYYKAENPYIFGKTGTLSNNHCLSGFLITKKGKLLIFSLMNNNYPDRSSPVKHAMEEILRNVHLNY